MPLVAGSQRLGPIFYRIGPMHSCNLINMWWSTKCCNFMRHVVFVSIFMRLWCLHCYGRCYLKSYAWVCMTHSRTIKIYDYNWDSASIVMEDAIWHRLQTYAWPTPGPSKPLIIAETVLTLLWAMLFEIVCKHTHYSLKDHHNLLL
jgi:hypothetical protein